MIDGGSSIVRAVAYTGQGATRRPRAQYDAETRYGGEARAAGSRSA